MTWVPEHLAAFIAAVDVDPSPADISGKHPEAFARALKLPTTGLFSRQITRTDLHNHQHDNGMDTRTLCAAVMAWGGMHMRHARKFFGKAEGGWLPIAEDLRAGQLSRQDAYTRFHKLRTAGDLPGAGPAYFTKLIHFVMPNNPANRRGYIMDQWASCSINLLIGRELVLMDVTRRWSLSDGSPQSREDFRASDANNADRYEAFCGAVDALRNETGLGIDEVDRHLVATGGKTKSDWRQYVIDHRFHELLGRDRS